MGCANYPHVDKCDQMYKEDSDTWKEELKGNEYLEQFVSYLNLLDKQYRVAIPTTCGYQHIGNLQPN